MLRGSMQADRYSPVEAREFRMVRWKRFLSLLCGASVLASSPGIDGDVAHGATATTTFTVSVTIAAACSISATNLAFGTQGVLAANVDQSSTITVNCTDTTPYSVGLDNGLNFSTTRRMKDTGAGTTFIGYGLYTDAGRTNAWTTSSAAGSCTGGANTCALGTGSGANQNITVYGRIPAQVTPAPATFNDTVTATVTY
jgi:spore coat protein U-like protein